MSLETTHFEFGDFAFDSDEMVLLRKGEPVPLTPKTIKLLDVLVKDRGHIVEKQTIIEAVWPDSFVEESNLTYTVRLLRKALGDEKAHPRFIETVPKRGYRFIADVVETSPGNGRKETGEIPFETIKTLEPAKGWRRPVFLGFMLIAVVSFFSAVFFAWRGSGPNLRSFLPGTHSENLELTFETVTNSGRSPHSVISLDGRYIAYVNTANAQPGIWIRQLSSGVNTQVVPPVKGVSFLGLEFSPDSEKIWYVRLLDQKMSLDCVSIFGGNAQQNIVSGLQGWFGISRDGSRISYIIHKGLQGNLFVADSNGANPHLLYTTPNLNQITDNAFSPDGKTIAFASGESNTASREFGVYTIDASGENLKPVTDFRWAHVRGIFWLPDQSGLLVTAVEKAVGKQQIWKITIPDGEVTKVTNSINDFNSISATADLKQILLTQASLTSALYLAPMSEPNNLQPVVQATMAVWTNDGKIIYASDSSGNRDIWRLETDRSNQKQLTIAPETDNYPVVAPDGRFIVFVSNRTGKNGIWRMNPDGTDPVLLTDAEGESEPVFTPDGRFVLYNSLHDLSLWKVSIAGGEKIKMPVENAHVISISPDGKKFAHIRRHPEQPKLLIRDFENCEILNEYGMPAGYYLSALKTVWLSDGSGIIYAMKDFDTAGNLWLQLLSGGDPKKLTDYNSEEIFNFSLSPDGQQIALTRGYWKHDAVLLKGFIK